MLGESKEKKDVKREKRFASRDEEKKDVISSHPLFAELYVFVCYQTFNGWMSFRAFEMSI